MVWRESSSSPVFVCLLPSFAGGFSAPFPLKMYICFPFSQKEYTPSFVSFVPSEEAEEKKKMSSAPTRVISNSSFFLPFCLKHVRSIEMLRVKIVVDFD